MSSTRGLEGGIQYRMVCEEYEQLKECHQAAMQDWSLAGFAPAWTVHSASRIREAEEARDEAIDLLGQHKDGCARCGISVSEADR